MTSLALAERGQVKAELTWLSESRQTAELLPALQGLLSQVGASLEDIDGLAVALGPGSFTGLRVGVSTAQGLAFARGIPLVGVGTLEIEAYPFAATGLPLCPLLDAGRGELAAALYRQEGEEWRSLLSPFITTLDGLLSQIQGPTLFCGSAAPSQAPALKERLGEKARVVGAAASLRRAGSLAELGWRRLARGEQDDPATLQPHYLRRPAISGKRGG